MLISNFCILQGKTIFNLAPVNYEEKNKKTFKNREVYCL